MLQPEEISEIERTLSNFKIDGEWKLISCVVEQIRQLASVTQEDSFLTDSTYALGIRRKLCAYVEMASYLADTIHGNEKGFNRDYGLRKQVYGILERTGILEKINTKNHK